MRPNPSDEWTGGNILSLFHLREKETNTLIDKQKFTTSCEKEQMRWQIKADSFPILFLFSWSGRINFSGLR